MTTSEDKPTTVNVSFQGEPGAGKTLLLTLFRSWLSGLGIKTIILPFGDTFSVGMNSSQRAIVAVEGARRKDPGVFVQEQMALSVSALLYEALAKRCGWSQSYADLPHREKIEWRDAILDALRPAFAQAAADTDSTRTPAPVMVSETLAEARNEETPPRGRQMVESLIVSALVFSAPAGRLSLEEIQKVVAKESGICYELEELNYAVRSLYHRDRIKIIEGQEEATIALDWPAKAPEGAPHPDDDAVDVFAKAMKDKLEYCREEEYRGGWDDPDNCPMEHLSDLLQHQMEKSPKDFVDIGNMAMMLYHRVRAL